MRFVLTPDSPSETLARVVMSRFKLNKLSSDPFESAKDAQDVFNRYKSHSGEQPMAYVLWEPFVSRMLENSDMHRVLDSSNISGYIVEIDPMRPSWRPRNRSEIPKRLIAGE